MNIIEYKIVKDELMHPKLIKAHTYIWNGKDFKPYKNIVDMMNYCFHMDKLNEEYGYVLSFDFNLNLLGVFEVGHGNSAYVDVSNKEIYTFLLLTGADKFTFIHNHPNGNLEISDGDRLFTQSVNAFSAIINIEMEESIIISRKGYTLIKDDMIKEFRREFKGGR